MPMLSVKDVWEDPSVQIMFRNRNLTEQSKLNYCKGIADFCSFFDANPKDLIEQFKNLSEDEIVHKFSEYFVDAKERLAPKSVWGWLPGIKAWLLENGIRSIDRVSREIAREFRRRFGSPKPILKRDILTKEEVIKILQVANLREKALICTLASGGFRLSTALKLKVKNIKDNMDDVNLPCYMIEVPEELTKENEPYITFISAEAMQYIRDCLLMRKGKGENITSESYLFTTERGNQPLSPKRFENIWRVLCEKAQIDMKPVLIKGKHPIGKRNGKIVYEERPRRYNTRIHALRKFFKTACSIAGVDRMASESFLGHTLTTFGVESLYDFSVSRKDWLRKEYLKVLESVTFLKPITKVSTEKQIEELQLKLAQAYTTIAELQARLQESITKDELLEAFKGTLPPHIYDKIRRKLESPHSISSY